MEYIKIRKLQLYYKKRYDYEVLIMRLRTLKSSAYIAGVVFSLLLSPLLASADDAYEPNDTIEEAYDVSALGSTLDGIMGECSSNDYYKLTVPTGISSLDISLSFPNATENLDLRLRNSSGDQIALANSTIGTSEQISYTDPGGGNVPAGIYYMQVMTPDTPANGAYTLSWNQFAPAVSAPDPADGADVQQGASGQLLRVTTAGATGCTIYYGIDNSTFTSVAGTMNGDFCESTVAYGATMLDNGINYWYVEASNDTGTTRYPEGSTNLSFTVYPPPEITNPDPAAGASVLTTTASMPLKVDVVYTDTCTIYYGIDGLTFASTSGTISGSICQADVAFGAELTDNGLNYWYAEAANSGGGESRYPATGSLTFTVYRTPSASNPVPADSVTVLAGASGQSLQVDIVNTDTCTFHYGASGIAAGSVSGSTCQVTVSYDANMSDDGVNSWYVDLANAGGGTARYPASGVLSFTVYQTPVISNPYPVNGSSVNPGSAGQLLRVQIAHADTCTIHYGVDETSLVSVAGVIGSGYCQTTVAYGADMTNEGLNYWYVEAANSGGGFARYPTTGTMSFTVKPSSILLLMPRIKSTSTP
jgi:hypothetical protein